MLVSLKRTFLDVVIRVPKLISQKSPQWRGGHRRNAKRTRYPNYCGTGRGRGVGRGLGVGVPLGVAVAVGVAVGVGVAVAVGVGLGVGVGVGATGTIA